MSFGSCYILKDNDFDKLESHNVDIAGSQIGLIMNIELTQCFMNTTEETAQISYIFPNDMKICIYEITFVMNNEIIKPKLIEKNEAIKIYDEMVKTGKTAIYCSNIADGLTEFKLGNLPVHSECKVILKMAFKGNLIDFHTFFFKIPLDVYTPNGSVECINIKSNFSMLIQAEKESIHSITSNIINGEFNSKDKTFIISNEIKNKKNENSIILQFKTKEIIENMIMLPTKDNYCSVLVVGNSEQQHINKSQEYIFLVDCSGSMRGNSIQNAGQCLELFIRSLPKDCSFNIIRFGSSYKPLFSNSRKYNEKTAKEGIKLAQTIKSDLGGTDIYEPLSQIFTTKPTNQRFIFILTDGEVDNKVNVIDLVRDNKKYNKCFTIGLGRGCDAGLVEGIAEASEGKCDFVQEGCSISEKVIPLLQASLYCSIDDIEVFCEGEDNDSLEIVPFPIPSLNQNGAIQLFIHNKNEGNEVFNNGILITGQQEHKTVDIPIYNVIDLLDYKEDQFGCSKGMNIGNAIKPLFAFEMLKLYEQKRNISQGERRKAIELSIESGVLCEFTGYVGMIDISKKTSSKIVTANHLRKYQSVIIDGKKYNVIDLTAFKSGKHGHSKISVTLIDPSSGKRIEQVVAGSETFGILSTTTNNDLSDTSNFDLFSLIKYQNFEGYWENHSEINKLAGIDINHIDKLKLNDDLIEDKCIATLVAIAILHVLAKTQVNSWKIIEEKGIKWLNKTIPDNNVDELLTDIEKLIQLQQGNSE